MANAARYILLIGILYINFVKICEAARILAVYPTPSISHHKFFWPFTDELAKRGHEIVVITTDLAYPKGEAPPNITEIDLHDISYDIWARDWVTELSGRRNDQYYILKGLITTMPKVVIAQMKSKEVQAILKDKRGFDLLLIEDWTRTALGFSHVFKVPTILVSSFGSLFGHYGDLGVQMHPLLYPILSGQRHYGLSFWEKIYEFYRILCVQYFYVTYEEEENKMLRQVLGDDMPSLSELSKNVDLLLLNHHPVWDFNRPVPANVVYVGGKRPIPRKELPKDIKSFLDQSVNGTIYMSLGSNVKPSILSKDKIRIIMKVFSELPYDVMFKYDQDELPGKPSNVRISKWFPQPDVLRHPKVKLFITQGGLQSTEEALDTGVPLIGMAVLGDQWFNCEKYDHFKIGMRLEFESLTEETFGNAIKKVIEDESYRRNIENLRGLMYDQPQSPMERAVWWTEHVLRHSHMGKPYRSPRAEISWIEYFELKLVAVLLAIFALTSIILVKISIILFKFLSKSISTSVKVKMT